VQEQLDRYPRNAIPYFRTFSVDVLPHLQNGDVFPSLTRFGTQSTPVAPARSSVGAASWSRTAARRKNPAHPLKWTAVDGRPLYRVAAVRAFLASQG
jgi:hypothetical protein